MRLSELDRFLALASELADAAGAEIRPHFRQRLAVEDKPDLTPVTAADRAAELAMRRLIENSFPDHGIVGEEFGRVREDAEFVWVLDPIDGTKSFISGVPLFGTLIALTHGGHPILGVIDQPISRERWIGATGRPTTLNGTAIRCRPCPALDVGDPFRDHARDVPRAGRRRLRPGFGGGQARRALAPIATPTAYSPQALSISSLKPASSPTIFAR